MIRWRRNALGLFGVHIFNVGNTLNFVVGVTHLVENQGAEGQGNESQDPRDKNFAKIRGLQVMSVLI